MTRTWKLIGINTLLAALLTSSPSPGQNGARSDGPAQKVSESKKLDDIQNQLDELKKELKKANAALATVTQELRSLRTDGDLRYQGTYNQITDLKDQFARLQVEVETLRKRADSTTREAGSPPELPASSGRVEMVNTYPSEIAIVINRRTYRVAPNETRLSEPIPAGTFTYEVLGYAPQKTRAVAANKIYSIWVHPQ
jgi:hypothetical protein